jgi:hypothetical protein
MPTLPQFTFPLHRSLKPWTTVWHVSKDRPTFLTMEACFIYMLKFRNNIPWGWWKSDLWSVGFASSVVGWRTGQITVSYNRHSYPSRAHDNCHITTAFDDLPRLSALSSDTPNEFFERGKNIAKEISAVIVTYTNSENYVKTYWKR